MNVRLRELEHESKCVNGKRIVVTSVGKEESSECSLGNLGAKHGLDFGGVAKIFPAGKLQENIIAFAPISLIQLFRSCDNMIANTLGWANEQLSIGKLNQSNEESRDNLSFDVVLMSSERRDLKEECA